MLTRIKARNRIIKFANKYAGQEIEVNKLNDKELYDFILTDTYLNVDALLGYDSDVCTTLDRAIEKANQHKSDGYVQYRKDNANYKTEFLAEGERL